MTEPNRYCVCGNKQPMVIKSGQWGDFYSCSDWKCKQTQGLHEQQPPVGSVNNQRPQPEVPQSILLNSKQTGYDQRKAWHEKHGIQFVETPQHQAMHLASK